MTVLVYGLDGLDARSGDKLALPSQELHQDFSGDNALWTYRVWPCIFAGEVGGEDVGQSIYEPDNSFIWERHPATVLMAPVERPPYCQFQDAFPDGYREGTTPPGHMEQTLQYYEEALDEAFRQDVPLVVCVTRMPDILQHKLPQDWDHYFDEFLRQAAYWCDRADDHLLVSDHGFDDLGTDGLDAHSRQAIFSSSFCSYDSMTEFCEGWHDDLDAVLRDQHLEDLGYT